MKPDVKAEIAKVVGAKKVETAEEKSRREREIAARTASAQKAQFLQRPARMGHLVEFDRRVRMYERDVRMQGIAIEALVALLLKKGVPLPLRIRRSLVTRTELDAEVKRATEARTPKAARGNDPGAAGAAPSGPGAPAKA
jgi:hypothetical protein